MIFGIGTDIVRVERMNRNLDRFGEKFARRILTENEFADFMESGQRAHFLAKRFAAKEATAKAMGTGFSNGISMNQIAVGHDPAGKPELVLTGTALDFLQSHNVTGLHISIADEQDHAVAFVTLSTP
jgi:holo-[acyl-carrier protein] synthase